MASNTNSTARIDNSHLKPNLELIKKPEGERRLPFSELTRLIRIVHTYNPMENRPEAVEEAIQVAREHRKEALAFWLETAQVSGLSVTLGNKLTIIDIRTGTTL